ncbi:PEP-CTERM-box response regulator transcription factor [Ampullimonas aquatilis]|uniref:PEP-CTERM-box response regulator transcription factor n=1 Tax=Ampullimonas aquatilis TaxID=1341549 RepID=UPI003C794B19
MAESKPTLLIVEDDPGLQKQLKWSFSKYDTLLASDFDEAIAHIRRFEPPVVTMDLGLPPEPDRPDEGLRLLEEILRLAPSTKVVVLTGQNDRTNALKAIQLGAYDFFAKPFEADLLHLVVDRAFALYELQSENDKLRKKISPSLALGGLITASPTMLKACRMVERAAKTDATALILGESGTGKELVARAFHDLSERRNKRFVAINCAAIPETLLESELFGYEKGAFTGAAKQTLGKIEMAQGGTLFLDEIGDLPLALQAKFLRFIQERVIERVGGREEIPVDIRIVCATHQNLKNQIGEGKFREDLFYRLSELVINLPPLRDREGDAVLIGKALLIRIAEQMSRKGLIFAEDALRAIEAYRWPGNVREMENCIKRAIIMADGHKITAEDLNLPTQPGDALPFLNLRQVRDKAEEQAVRSALARAENNIVRASEMLGVSRPTLYDLMYRFGIK